MWLWDSNIVRAYTDPKAEGYERVRARADRVGWGEIGLPIVVAAELVEGRLRSTNQAYRQSVRQLLPAFERLLDTFGLISLF